MKGLLFADQLHAAELDSYIVDRYKAGLTVLKTAAGAVQQRSEYHIGLGLGMPHTDDRETLDAVCKRLGVSHGKRSSKGRLKASSQAFAQRSVFDAAAAQLEAPLTVGEPVLCRGEPAELVELEQADGTGTCVVKFSLGGEEKLVRYVHSFGKVQRKVPAGSARLRRPSPTLAPPHREVSGLSVSREVREHVRDLYYSQCATSPHQVHHNLFRFLSLSLPLHSSLSQQPSLS